MDIEGHFARAAQFAFTEEEQDQLNELVENVNTYQDAVLRQVQEPPTKETLRAFLDVALLAFAAGRSFQLEQDSILLPPQVVQGLIETLFS